MKEFKEVMIKKRKDMNISRYRLAKLTGITEANIYNFEAGRTDKMFLLTAVKIATVLDIDLNKLKGEN